jgi:pyridoxamine 5'-phosphate oxidase
MTDPLYAEALDTFGRLLEEATHSGLVDPNAMTVATAGADGRPSARTVLLKTFDARGFAFYTHLDSPKGRDLRANPHAALLFLWRGLREAGVQARIEGEVVQVDDAEADVYFASRPRMSQLGAWASIQSATLGSRAEFEARLAEVEARFAGGEVPRPAGWSGFRVVPASFEFWYGAGFRLHERWCYERSDGGAWSKRMLYP